MKVAVGLSLASILVFAGTACLGAAPPDGQQSSPAAGQPKRGGIFHIPQVQPNPDLNPHATGRGGTMAPLMNTMYEGLVARDAQPHVSWHGDPKLKPWLAERWERPDENTYLFQLRTDVKWHDGRPFTADDVVHSIEYLKERPNLIESGRVANIKSVEVLDSHRIRIVTRQPNPDFLVNDVIEVSMTPRHLAAEGKQLETLAVGTGPFKFKQLDKTAGWRVARNEDYWVKDPSGSGQGLPYLDGVAGHYLTDRGTMTAAMAAGNLDAMTVADKALVEAALAAKGDLLYDKVYYHRGLSILFAMDRPPFDDIRVRRAINLAIDRQDMVVKGALGDGVINPPFISGWAKAAIPQEELVKLPGYNPATRERDVAQAKQLLAEAGVRSLSAKLSFPGANTNETPAATVAAAQLKELLGIEIVLQPLDTATFNKVQVDGTWEMRTATVGRGRSSLQEALHSKGKLNKRGPFDSELDALVDKYLAEFDDAQADRLYQEIQRLLYDKAYVVGTISRALFTVYQPWLHDMLDNFGGQIVLWYTPPALWIDVDMLPAHRRAEKP